jgi:YbbR domain-containing protein
VKKNVNIYIYAFLFAVVLWVYLSLNLVYTVNLSVPIKVQLLKSQALSEELPSDMEVTLRGRGWDLLNMLISKDVAYNLDLTGIKRNTRIIAGSTISERINIPFNVTVLSTNPDTLAITFDNVAEKYIKVRNNVTAQLKDDYQLIGAPKVFPDSVKVRGASSVLSKLRFIPTEYEVIKNVNSSFSRTIQLKDTLGNLIQVEPQAVEVRFDVQLAAEKTFDDLHVEIVGLPPDKEVLLVPPKLSLSLKGGVENLSKLTPGEIRVYIDYSKIENDTLGFIVPQVNLPFEATIVSLSPDKFEYIIKKR